MSMTRIGSGFSMVPSGPPPIELFWTCDLCGVIEPRLLPSGRYMRRECECQRRERWTRQIEEARQIEMSKMTDRTYGWLGKGWEDLELAGKTFANFRQNEKKDGYQAAVAYAHNPVGSLILYGSYGTGKTHLLAAICNALREQQTRSLFTTAPKLFAAYQDRMLSEGDHWSLVKQAISTPLLVLDDIDKAKPSEAREQLYFLIIDERVKAGKPIALSTNKLSELAHYVGGACVSRLMEHAKAVEMIGRDQRLGVK